MEFVKYVCSLPKPISGPFIPSPVNPVLLHSAPFAFGTTVVNHKNTRTASAGLTPVGAPTQSKSWGPLLPCRRNFQNVLPGSEIFKMFYLTDKFSKCLTRRRNFQFVLPNGQIFKMSYPAEIFSQCLTVVGGPLKGGGPLGSCL